MRKSIRDLKKKANIVDKELMDVDGKVSNVDEKEIQHGNGNKTKQKVEILKIKSTV